MRTKEERLSREDDDDDDDDDVFFSFVFEFFFLAFFGKKRSPKKRADSFGAVWTFSFSHFQGGKNSAPPPCLAPKKKRSLRASCPHFVHGSLDLRDEEMEGYYWTQFGVLAVLCTVMEFQKFTQKEKNAK